jgi:hypothetical protein
MFETTALVVAGLSAAGAAVARVKANQAQQELEKAQRCELVRGCGQIPPDLIHLCSQAEQALRRGD